MAVREAVTELGYRPDRSARSLARKDSHLLGVVLDVTHPFHGVMVDALDTAAEEVGFDMILSSITARRNGRSALETLVDSRCSGVVLLGWDADSLGPDMLSDPVPVVVIGRTGAGPAVGIMADDLIGLRLGVTHLAQLGHERIAHVDGGRGAVSTSRRAGYRAAMRARGWWASRLVIPGGDTESAGMKAGERIASMPRNERPTGIVAFNDRCALGVRDALLRQGIDVPGDLSVVGYDDSPLAQLATVDLTSVSQDPPALARACIETIRAGLAGRPVRDQVVEPYLVVRGSTGPVPTT